MTFTSPRATLEETLAFANAVRQAGGGNPLDALMPAVPSDPTQCLIARNLNFNCSVGGLEWQDDDDGNPNDGLGWYMRIHDKETACSIAEALELSIVWDGPESLSEYADKPDADPGAWAIVLPQEIGQVASDFDRWSDAVRMGLHCCTIRSVASEEELEVLRSFWPFVEASQKEACDNADFVNDKGELIL